MGEWGTFSLLLSNFMSLLPEVMAFAHEKRFRWDYYHKHKKDMYAFEEFLNDGVQAEWVEPIFPPYLTRPGQR